MLAGLAMHLSAWQALPGHTHGFAHIMYYYVIHIMYSGLQLAQLLFMYRLTSIAEQHANRPHTIVGLPFAKANGTIVDTMVLDNQPNATVEQ